MELVEREDFAPKMDLPVLSGGTSDDFGRGIVEMPVVIIVEHARVEKFLLPNGDQDFIAKAIAERIQESKWSCEIRSSICGLRKFPSQRSFVISRARLMRKYWEGERTRSLLDKILRPIFGYEVVGMIFEKCIPKQSISSPILKRHCWMWDIGSRGGAVCAIG